MDDLKNAKTIITNTVLRLMCEFLAIDSSSSPEKLIIGQKIELLKSSEGLIDSALELDKMNGI